MGVCRPLPAPTSLCVDCAPQATFTPTLYYTESADEALRRARCAPLLYAETGTADEALRRAATRSLCELNLGKSFENIRSRTSPSPDLVKIRPISVKTLDNNLNTC